MSNIGVEVTTSVRSGPSNPGTPAGIFHVAGLTERGPVNRPVTVRSLAQFGDLLGGRTAYSSHLYDTARLFWEEGGSELVVSRVVGPAATRGELVLMDTSSVETIRVESIEPGTYSENIAVTVTSDAGTFTVTVAVDGVLVHSFAGLTSPADLVAAARGSQYVNVLDLGSVTAAPGNNPVAVEDAPLSAGTDDRAGVTAQSVIAALDSAGEAAAGGAVAAPGYTADVIGTDLLAHAAAHSKIALLAAGPEASTEDAIGVANTIGGGEHGAYGGLFYPHVVVPDGRGSRVVSPEGYVAAVRSRAFVTEGYWQVPAGDRARTTWVLGTAQGVDIATNNELSAAHVNGIVTSGTKTRLYNWTSLSADRENFGLLSARDTLNNLSLVVAESLEPHVFSTLDGRGHLLAKVKTAVVGVLAPVAKRGGFYAALDAGGQETDPGYRVTVDASNNPAGSAADNQVNVSVAVRLSPAAALIKVEIIKVPVTASV